MRRELAQIIEASTDAIVAGLQRAAGPSPGDGTGDDAGNRQELVETGREVIAALPGELRARQGSRVPARAAASLSAASRYRLHTLLAPAVWGEAANQAPGDWSPVVAMRLQEDVRTAIARALGGTADECVAELDEALSRRRQEHMAFCARMVREHEEQRERLASHMHDVIAQALAAARYHANVAQRVLPRDTAAAAGEALEAQRLIEHALAQIRHIMAELRPIALERFGLRAAITDYVAGLRRDNGVDVAFHGNGDMPELCPVTQSVLFRMLQDVFDGMLLPLGATAATVRFHVQGDAASLVIEQEGYSEGDGENGDKGGSAREVRAQLAMLRARAELVGGTVSSDVGAGYPARIEISVPVNNGGA